ncbi:NADH:flavin oxidoreductase/NADH oxidase [Xylariaceae sp. FL1651]|nr:NADH:flavin oxidoreductase/NADH oxidase [Xylariaceae sp. FL1651]
MTKLFKPMRVGAINLDHRVVMAPLTRYRNDDDWVPQAIVKEYYEQRAAVPGTLLISEATMISRSAASENNSPGMFNDAQIAGWKEITDAVHKKGCFIYCQLWHLGRGANPEGLKAVGSKLKSASAIPIDETSAVPEEMTEDDIWEVIGDYVTAAKNAMAAGFDGVEIHGANGYLIDQFLQDRSNQRTDAWGGSIEKRARFGIEVTKAVVKAVGADRTAIRLSPFSDFNGMLMKNPYPQFEYLVKELKPLNLAYLHLIEARISGNIESNCGTGHSVDFLVKLWNNQSPIIVAGGFQTESALKAVDETWKDFDVGIAFGRYFISNPDLVFRVKEGIELTKYDRSVFYTPKKSEGYVDYPFSAQFLSRKARI